MSSIFTCSFILWIEALIGPNSTTCLQIFAIKRPSDVPPVVETYAVMPVISDMAEVNTSVRKPF